MTADFWNSTRMQFERKNFAMAFLSSFYKLDFAKIEFALLSKVRQNHNMSKLSHDPKSTQNSHVKLVRFDIMYPKIT